jgi:GDP-4-dehydro-6-deoxy-D-mannose reductase
MRRALITGASGFAGRHLARRLAASGAWEVIGLSARPHTAGPELHHHLTCDLLNADLTRRTILHWRPDIIFHLAAASYVPRSFSDPAGTLVNNVVGQVNLLEAVRLLDPPPTVLVVSSSDVYGLVYPEELPVTEAQPFRPVSPYGVSKLAQDMLGLQYHLSYRMPVVRVRPFSHVGPEQSDRFAIASFARQIAEAEAGLAPAVLLVGNLDVERDLLDVRDVVRAYEMVARPELAGQVFNIAGGRSWSMREIVARLLALATVSMEVRQDPSRVRPTDIAVLRGDATSLREATGWVPEIPLENTLADTLEYWRRTVRRCHWTSRRQ